MALWILSKCCTDRSADPSHPAPMMSFGCLRRHLELELRFFREHRRRQNSKFQTLYPKRCITRIALLDVNQSTYHSSIVEMACVIYFTATWGGQSVCGQSHLRRKRSCIQNISCRAIFQVVAREEKWNEPLLALLQPAADTRFGKVRQHT